MTASTLAELRVSVSGRPAPQGSKNTGTGGQMREQSAYLSAWRAAVKRAVYQRYRDLGVAPAALPLLHGPVGLRVTFRLDPARRADGPPDIDKLLRGVCDALTQARVWEDDSRVIEVSADKRSAAPGEPTGADIEVWSVAG